MLCEVNFVEVCIRKRSIQWNMKFYHIVLEYFIAMVQHNTLQIKFAKLNQVNEVHIRWTIVSRI
jgi:hypothetical protein